MNVAVLGLWHLGSVTAACTAAAGHDVTAWDPDPAVVRALRNGYPAVAEPGLADLVTAQTSTGRLRLVDDLGAAVASADVVWIAFDTPVDDDDRADVESVLEQVRRAVPLVREGAVILVSSQLPVGTVRRLEQELREVLERRRLSFAYAPENLRLGNAIQAFRDPDRIVVGVRNEDAREVLTALFVPIASRMEWMSVESAEMTKHAINAFLAVSVAFVNELAVLCEQVGADAKEVERGLKTERRIGPRAYLSPGGAFAGGTLARDVAFLGALSERAGVRTPLLAGVRESNDHHRGWPQRTLSAELGDLRGKRVAVWGLTYKAGTDTLRRSASIELCRWLADAGAEVAAHDPSIRTPPPELEGIASLASDPIAAASGAHALVVATEWPLFKSVPVEDLIARMQPRPVICDPNRLLASTLGKDARVRYATVGRPRS